MVRITLPDREERLELVGERIKNLGNHFKMADDVCPVLIAELTNNFTEDELCTLVREAAGYAVTAYSRTANPGPLQVTQRDFFQALSAIEPRFGVQTERLKQLTQCGFFYWMRPAQKTETKPEIDNIKISADMAYGSLLNKDFNECRASTSAPDSSPETEKQAAGWSSAYGLPSMGENMAGGIGTWIKTREPLLQTNSEGHIPVEMPQNQGLTCQLIEGPSKSGKSCVAAAFAQNSNVPFVKVIWPADFLELPSASEKCRYIQNILEDAYVSQDSIVILDDLERLLEYVALGNSYSNEVLQALMVLLKKQPPRGHRLHILCTSSRRDVLEKLGMLSVFTSVTHVPNLSRPEHILSVAEASKHFEREELRAIEAAIVDKPISIGIKRLLDLFTWVNPLKPDRRVAKLLERMGAEMGWEKTVH